MRTIAEAALRFVSVFGHGTNLASGRAMRTFLAFGVWCLWLILCWPVALLMLFLFPLVWLLLLPFRIVGFTLELVFKIIGGILLFPFRLVKSF
jgi:hypothetical protein